MWTCENLSLRFIQLYIKNQLAKRNWARWLPCNAIVREQQEARAVLVSRAAAAQEVSNICVAVVAPQEYITP